MRIACIGNMNNIIAPTAQYLSDLGHEVDLFLLYEFDHFKPEADYQNPGDIRFKIKRIEMDFAGVMRISKATLKANFEGYDFYIGTDYAPALLARIGKKLDVFAWAGTDLFEWPFYKSAFRIPQAWECQLYKTAAYQFEGIRAAGSLPMSINNDFITKALQKVGATGRIIEPLPFMYYPLLQESNSIESPQIDLMRKLREANDVILIQQSRQWWKTAPSHITKGNDIFLTGAAHFISNNPGKRVAIVLFEYGADVAASKALIKDLGLEDKVHWMPTVLRKEMLALLSMADLGIGQFGSESWYLYCSNAEIIATGIGYVGYRDDAYYAAQGMALYPMFNCNNAEQISDAFNSFCRNMEASKALAAEAQVWLKAYNETKFFENIQVLLNEKQNQKLSFGARFRLFIVNASMQCVEAINRIILKTKSEFLRKNILEWRVS